ncbi:hypothetical protein JHW43_007017 [Diplocarpon mali]|nr:hypothetical protein JHW43_007017 [Diplocarpon mali]
MPARPGEPGVIPSRARYLSMAGVKGPGQATNDPIRGPCAPWAECSAQTREFRHGTGPARDQHGTSTGPRAGACSPGRHGAAQSAVEGDRARIIRPPLRRPDFDEATLYPNPKSPIPNLNPQPPIPQIPFPKHHPAHHLGEARQTLVSSPFNDIACPCLPLLEPPPWPAGAVKASCLYGSPGFTAP